MRQMVLELNASDDRGIDVVREQIKTFASESVITSPTGLKMTIEQAQNKYLQQRLEQERLPPLAHSN